MPPFGLSEVSGAPGSAYPSSAGGPLNRDRLPTATVESRPRCSRFGRPPGPPESGPSKRKTLSLGGPALRCTARVFRCSVPPESGPKFRKTQKLRGGFALEEASDFQARRLADRSFRRLNNAGWPCLEEPSEIQVRGLADRNTGRR